jgi:hypothetical protein
VRVPSDPVIRALAQLDEVEHLVDALSPVAAVVVGEHPEVPSRGQIRVEPRPFDEAGDVVERAGAVDDGIPAEQPRRAFRRANQAEEHPQRRRLAGAVRAEIAEDVAARDGQVHVVDGGQVAVTLDQVSRFDRQVVHFSDRAAASAAEAGSEPTST